MNANSKITNVLETDEYRKSFKNVFLKHCYPNIKNHSKLDSTVLHDIHMHSENRILHFENVMIPWLEEVTTLKNKKILEIGCGTGAMTVPFALRAQEVFACDVWDTIEVARERTKLFGCDNVNFILNDLNWLSNKNGVNDFFEAIPDVEIITLDAVLEHLTISERLVILENIWKKLKVGGILVLYDTPNRLAYFDSHTYQCYFLHSLPDDLARSYILKFSERRIFEDELNQDDWKTRLYKSGRGVSYHEFEMVMDFGKISVLADGFSPLFNSKNEHNYYQAMKGIFEEELPHIPRGFSGEWLNLIIRKDKE